MQIPFPAHALSNRNKGLTEQQQWAFGPLANTFPVPELLYLVK